MATTWFAQNSSVNIDKVKFTGAALSTSTGVKTTLSSQKIKIASTVDLSVFGTPTSGTGTFGQPSTAGTDASSATAPVPANQTTPAANTGVLAAVVTPTFSGKFLVTGSLQFTGVAANAVTIKLRSQTKTAAIVTGNATATGLNCFFAAANGPITYGGGTTAQDLDVETFTVLAGSLTGSYDFVAVVVPNANNAIVIGKNVAFEITVASAANVTSLTGTLGVTEVS